MKLSMRLLLILLLATSQCTLKKEPTEYPEDFRFRLTTATFDYDSETQRYVYYDRSVIVPLTDEEITEIYKYARDISFMTFPNAFDCSGCNWSIPCFSNQLTIRYDRMLNQSKNDCCCAKSEEHQSAHFQKLVQKIRDILDVQEQVRNLPRYDIVRL